MKKILTMLAAMAMMQTAVSQDATVQASAEPVRVIGEKLDSGLGSMVYGESLDSGLGELTAADLQQYLKPSEIQTASVAR